MAALTKADIADTLSERMGLNKRESKEIVERYFENIRTLLGSAENVKISGWGNYELNDKGPRPGRNPKTGEPVTISARRVVTFHAGQKLRARVEAYSGKNNNE